MERMAKCIRRMFKATKQKRKAYGFRKRKKTDRRS